VAALGYEGRLPFDPWLMAKVAVAGVAFGLAALLFAEMVHGIGRVFRTMIPWPAARPPVGALLIIGLVFVLGTRDYLGIGVTSPEAGGVSIVSSFEAGGAHWDSWWWKIVFTALALGSGFKGGEVTPLFFIGATLGNRLAALMGGPADLFAAVGFVAIFAGAANTPLACIVMGIELFGADASPYLAVGCVVAYLASGHSGIYLSQRVDTPKVGVALGDASLRSMRDGRHRQS